MALIFPRLARNFVKNGYFPTDEATLTRIIGALDVADPDQAVRVLDPCCGEGAALAEVRSGLNALLTDGARAVAYGIEYDRERAWHAKTVLDIVAHADVHDMFVTARSTGLLFLNPPYGDVMSDKAGIGDNRPQRLEKVFYHKSVPWLAFGGVLMLIVPHYVMNRDFATAIARHFTQVEVFLAPEQQFKQLVLFGVKRRADGADPALVERLSAIGQGVLPPELPEVWPVAPYLVPPASTDTLNFVSTRIDAEQLTDELARLERAGLWPQFDTMFSVTPVAHRRPLRDLSDWHLALALAAGQISGVVTGRDGTQLLIKGDTVKEKDQEVKVEGGNDGALRTTILSRDKFVPTIVGIDFTPGPNLGRLVMIR